MNLRYEIILERLYQDVSNDIITFEEAQKVDDLAYEKYVCESKEYKYNEDQLTKMVQSSENEHKQILQECDELEKTWNYNQSKRKVKKLYESALMIQTRLLRYKKSNKDADISALKSRIDKLIKNDQSRLSKLNKLEMKKTVNRFNNKYWIDYTKKHAEAFRETEKELRGYNTDRGMKHDYDKYIMYHFLPAPIAHILHVQFNRHHTRRARTKEDYTQMMINMECNRKTKPDKQMKPYQVIDAFYPELKQTMIPILKEYGLPTNAEEDRRMSAKKKEKR